MCEFKNCRVPAVPGESLCILHMPIPKDLNQFREALYRQIDEIGPLEIRNARFSFVGYRFPCTVTIGGIKHRLSSQAVVLPETINEITFFTAAKIHGNVEFALVKAKHKIDLSYATVYGSVGMLEATIDGDLDLSSAEIHGSIILHNATINGSLLLPHAEIDKRIDLSHAHVWWNVDFSATRVNGSVAFVHSHFNKNLRFPGCTVGSIYLERKMPKINRWRVDVKRCGVSILRDDAASAFWGFASRSLSANGERRRSDDAFYFSKLHYWRERRRSQSRPGRLRILRTILRRAFYGFLWLIDLCFLRWSTAYGASLTRLFTTWIVVIGGFGITFSLMPDLIKAPAREVPLWNWIVGFHYSTTTFATLGLGNIEPSLSRLSMFLTSIEALLGAILIALAVLVIGRKFMR